MNYTITDNPYREGMTILSNGVGISSKVAKLNDDKKSYEVTKRDRLAQNWENNRPKETVQNVNNVSASPKVNYDELLNKIGISAVVSPMAAENSGAKKLRVNKIVVDKAGKIYNNSNHIAAPVQMPAVKEEVKMVQEPVNPIPTVPEPSVNEEVHGRHEKTGEIPVQGIENAIRNNDIPVGTRTERNAMASEMINRENVKVEPKGGDVDLYNSLLHNDGAVDVSKQLQGARLQLEEVKDEGRKLAAQYSEAVQELEQLKKDIEYQNKIRQEQEKNELSTTLKDIAAIKQANLARTSDLSSIQAEIARLKAERENMMANDYDARSMGRAA